MSTVCNGEYNYKERIDLILKLFKKSNIQVIENTKRYKYFDSFKIVFNNSEKIVNILSKNIVNSGWKEKPQIRRIQIPALFNVEIPLNTANEFSFLLGMANVDGQLIVCVWNPFSSVYHKTNCSCYINVNTLSECKECFVLNKFESNKNILLCDENHFYTLLQIYIEENCMS